MAPNNSDSWAPLPVWPVFTTAQPQYLQQDISSAVLSETTYKTNNHCTFWDPQITFPTT